MNCFKDGIVNVFDEPALHREAAHGGKKTLGNAVNGVRSFGIAEGCHDITVAQDHAVGGGPLLRQRAQRGAEGMHLIDGEIPLIGVRLREGHGLLKFNGVHADFGGLLSLPRALRRKVGGGFLRQRCKHRQEDQQGGYGRTNHV